MRQTTWYVYEIAGMHERPDVTLNTEDGRGSAEWMAMNALGFASTEDMLKKYHVTTFPHHGTRMLKGRRSKRR